MADIKTKTRVVDGICFDSIPEEIIQSPEPVLLKGLVRGWPLVEAGLNETQTAIDYLKSFYNGKPSLVNFGNPGIDGRYFYQDDVASLNYETRRAQLDEVMDLILASQTQDPQPSYYITSNAIDSHFPGLREHNDLLLPREQKPYKTSPPDVKIWIGTPSVATCHYDALDNIACCVAGKRRFTLFPPSQFENLYFGPLENTPGGQAISMVNFDQPDYQRFPNFRKAEAAGQYADMEPGDAVFVPSMWMHHVEGLSRFNILINYWWNDAPLFTGSGMNVLYHALLSLRDKPAHEKEGWKHLFDYYVFGDSQRAGAHLPESARGVLGELDDMKARQLRAMLINRLNR